MPRPLSWLPMLPIIRRSVSNSVRSHYGRKELEQLFSIQPRAAGKLLELLPTMRVLNGLMVERGELERFLDRVAETGDVGSLLEQVRAERAAPSRRKIRGMKRYDIDPIPMAALPDCIQLERGRMVVDFSSVDELAQAMFMLAGVLHHELEAFAATYEPTAPLREEAKRERADMAVLFAELRQREAALSSL